MLPPHWLDQVIEAAVKQNDPQAVARAVAHSERVLKAITDALNAPEPGPKVMGPSKTQRVRQAVREAIGSDS